jgi:tetratricopeptide (TPR) repeat protein
VVDRARVDHIDDPFRVAISHSLLGLALGLDASKADEAMAHERTALAIMDQAFGGKNVISVLSMLMNLSSTQEEIGQLDEALKSVSDAVATCEAAIARKEVVPQHIDLGLGLLTRGDILVRLGRHAEALDSLRRATEICQANGRTDAVPSIDADLARALIGLGRLDEAARVLSEGRAIADANKETGPDVRAILLRTAADLALAGAKPRTDEALELAEAALKLAETGASDLYDLSSTRLVVARALSRAQRDPERVRTLAARAAEGFEKLHDRRRAEEAAAVASAGK